MVEHVRQRPGLFPDPNHLQGKIGKPACRFEAVCQRQPFPDADRSGRDRVRDHAVAGCLARDLQSGHERNPTLEQRRQRPCQLRDRPELPYVGIQMQDIPRAYLADPDSTESGSSDGLGDYLLTRVDDEELARVIPDFDMIFAALKLEYNPQRLEELKT